MSTGAEGRYTLSQVDEFLPGINLDYVAYARFVWRS